MKLSKEQIQKIADLVRLELSDKEKEKFSTDLTSILGFVEKLDEVDVKNIQITENDLVNNYAEDKAEPSDIDRKEILKNAPMTEDGFIKVKSVLE